MLVNFGYDDHETNERTLNTGYFDPAFEFNKVPETYNVPDTSKVAISSKEIDPVTKVIAKQTQATVPILPKAETRAQNTDYTLRKEEIGKWMRIDSTTDINVLLPVSMPKDSIFMGVQAGVGKLTFIGDPAPLDPDVVYMYDQETVINPVIGYLPQTRDQGAVFALIHIGNNTWDLMGDIALE